MQMTGHWGILEGVAFPGSIAVHVLPWVSSFFIEISLVLVTSVLCVLKSSANSTSQ